MLRFERYITRIMCFTNPVYLYDTTLKREVRDVHMRQVSVGLIIFPLHTENFVRRRTNNTKPVCRVCHSKTQSPLISNKTKTITNTTSPICVCDKDSKIQNNCLDNKSNRSPEFF